MRRKSILLLIVSGIVMVADQITKALVQAEIPLYQIIQVIPGFFNLTHIHNPGGAFGFLADSSEFWRQVFFLAVSGVAVGLIIIFYFKTPTTHRYLSFGFAMILGGALGNMIDRVRMGKVVDFLDFYISDYHWPAFNVADSAITIGISVFAFHLIFNKMPDG